MVEISIQTVEHDGNHDTYRCEDNNPSPTTSRPSSSHRRSGQHQPARHAALRVAHEHAGIQHNRLGQTRQGRQAKPAQPRRANQAEIAILLNGNELIGRTYDLAMILHELKYIELNLTQGGSAAVAMAAAPPQMGPSTLPGDQLKQDSPTLGDKTDTAETRNRRGCRGGNRRGKGSNTILQSHGSCN